MFIRINKCLVQESIQGIGRIHVAIKTKSSLLEIREECISMRYIGGNIRHKIVKTTIPILWMNELS